MDANIFDTEEAIATSLAPSLSVVVLSIITTNTEDVNGRNAGIWKDQQIWLIRAKRPVAYLDQPSTSLSSHMLETE